MLEFQSSAQLAVVRAVVSSAPRGAARGISIFCIASIPIWHVQCAASYSLPEITGNSGFRQPKFHKLTRACFCRCFWKLQRQTAASSYACRCNLQEPRKTCCTSGTLAALCVCACVSWCNRMHLIRQYPTHFAMAVDMMHFVTSLPVPAYILRGF